jgi:hypothetical protein
MAARAMIGVGCGDGADRMHVVVAAAFEEVYGAPSPAAVPTVQDARNSQGGHALESSALAIARTVYALIGIGSLLMIAGQFTSGPPPSFLSDPVFAAGLALGILALGTAAWVEAEGTARAVVAWLGIIAVAVAGIVFVALAMRTPSADVLALVGVPTLICLAASLRLAIARVTAGALGG